MAVLFAGRELLEVALEIEKNGQAFYEELGNCTKDQGIEEVARFMAEEEKRHVIRFQEILESTGGYQISEAYYATQYMGYMKALADERVFKSNISVPEVAERARSPREAIDIAIGFEKESILFLHEMRELAPESDRKAIQKLLSEERDHLRRLSAMKAQIS